MRFTALSTCILTEKVSESRDFYTRYFAGKVVFDCGWYVSVEFGTAQLSLQFMQPQNASPACNTAGLTYNFKVEDVDAEYEKLQAAGMEIAAPPEDHPWGDRGFAVQDPNGVMLYVYSDREPSAEFKPFFKN